MSKHEELIERANYIVFKLNRMGAYESKDCVKSLIDELTRQHRVIEMVAKSGNGYPVSVEQIAKYARDNLNPPEDGEWVCFDLRKREG